MASRKPENPEVQLVQAAQLLDAYGELLTERQRQFMGLHYDEDLSFSQIAREFNVSRQAVHDSVKHATSALRNFERVLGLVSRTGGAAQSGEVRLQGRQLVTRLRNLGSRTRAAVPPHLHWIAEELEELASLLQGGSTDGDEHV